jgi:hypothetical protein
MLMFTTAFFRHFEILYTIINKCNTWEKTRGVIAKYYPRSIIVEGNILRIPDWRVYNCFKIPKIYTLDNLRKEK